MIIHLIMMIVMILVMSVTAIALFVIDKTTDYNPSFGSYEVGIYCIALLNVLALVCGLIYLLRGYSKNAAGFYRAFLMFTAAFLLLTVIYNFMVDGFAVGIILRIVKILILFVMVFGKDLGKKTTWILFGVMVVIDVVNELTGNDQSILAYRMVSLVSELVMDGTIALAVRGKYADKDARGTK